VRAKLVVPESSVKSRRINQLALFSRLSSINEASGVSVSASLSSRISSESLFYIGCPLEDDQIWTSLALNPDNLLLLLLYLPEYELCDHGDGGVTKPMLHGISVEMKKRM